jgi:hypothetical protein
MSQFHDFEFRRNDAGHMMIFMDGQPLRGISKCETSATASEGMARITIEFLTPLRDKSYVDRVLENNILGDNT